MTDELGCMAVGAVAMSLSISCPTNIFHQLSPPAASKALLAFPAALTTASDVLKTASAALSASSEKLLAYWLKKRPL